MNATNFRKMPMTRIVQMLGLGAVLAALAGCSAAPAPCLIQRPPLGGYINKLTIKGTVPPGCENNLPTTYADNLRWDGYSDQLVVVKADSMPYPDKGGDPDPSHQVVGQGKLSVNPDPNNICTIPDVSLMEADVDPFGLGPGQEKFSYKISNVQLLDGARYQGSTYQADFHVVIGTCQADYTSQALSPGVFCASDDDCNPFADPSKGRAVGSGINPDYSVFCDLTSWATTYTGDPTVGICFFNKPFPGLK
jgi:hypothetical protein